MTSRGWQKGRHPAPTPSFMRGLMSSLTPRNISCAARQDRDYWQPQDVVFQLATVKERAAGDRDGDLSPEQANRISETLCVPKRDAISINRRLAAPDHSLNAPPSDRHAEWQDWPADEAADQENHAAKWEDLAGREALLRNAMETLNERERRILIECRFKDQPVPLEQLPLQYGVSRERVRQIEVRAFEKLQFRDRCALNFAPCPRRYGMGRLETMETWSRNTPGFERRRTMPTFRGLLALVVRKLMSIY